MGGLAGFYTVELYILDLSQIFTFAPQNNKE